jgi:branched-chain amino acid aminotransferase
MNPGINPTFLILARLLPETDKDIYKKGVKLITYEHKRFIPSAKTLNYIQLIKSFKKLKKEKAFTLLYTSEGNISEGATCNIFFFKRKKLITPKTGILNGITRNLVIKLAGKNFIVQQKDVKLGILNFSEEAFITMTTKGIVPVVKIDKHTIGNGKPGKNTKIIMKLFDKYINNFIKCTT